MAILITDTATEQYAIDIANSHGRLSKSAAMRLIAEEHKQFSREREERERQASPDEQANELTNGRAAAAAS